MKIDSLDVIGGTNTPMDLAQYSIYFWLNRYIGDLLIYPTLIMSI